MDLVAARTADLSGSLSSDRLIVARKGRWAGCGTKTVQGSNRFERAQSSARGTHVDHDTMSLAAQPQRLAQPKLTEQGQYCTIPRSNPVPTPFSPPNSIHQNSPTSSGRGRLNYKLSST